jgi:hypothetical protein
VCGFLLFGGHRSRTDVDRHRTLDPERNDPVQARSTQTDIATQAKYNATLIFLCDAKPCQQETTMATMIARGVMGCLDIANVRNGGAPASAARRVPNRPLNAPVDCGLDGIHHSISLNAGEHLWQYNRGPPIRSEERCASVTAIQASADQRRSERKNRCDCAYRH